MVEDFIVQFTQAAQQDVLSLPQRVRPMIRRAVESRLRTQPHCYGKPLRMNLKGLWKLKVGDYRVIFRMSGKEVIIIGIGHRKDIYRKISPTPLA